MPHNSNLTSGAETQSPHYPLIVQSHLRWDFVWQRPQQLMSRLAREAPVYFLEEPVYLDDITHNSLDVTSPCTGVFRAVPRLRSDLRGDYDSSIAVTRDLAVRDLAKRETLFSNAVQWFYTPMPAPAMIGAFNEIGVVYDCMDELAQFRNAPADIHRRERLLLSNADVVFTGGRKLFTAKSRLHANVHFFGCGVDATHFAQARRASTAIPEDCRFDSKVAGYFGVIDERLDYDLIRSLAEQHPEIAIVMIGPTAKVSPDELPTTPNIHWLGQRSYEELPAYVKAFDVCLMPFAINEATEFINPTKTLEYMAAAKPIVSTAVADVVRNFGSIVSVAYSREEFISAVERSLHQADPAAIAEGLDAAASASWESIVDRMRGLISDAVSVLPIALAVEPTVETSRARAAELRQS
jgi:glycosyltransferase involved in cell wall biosynthesis